MYMESSLEALMIGGVLSKYNTIQDVVYYRILTSREKPPKDKIFDRYLGRDEIAEVYRRCKDIEVRGRIAAIILGGRDG